MLRESFDLINGHLERSVPGTSPSTVQISCAGKSSAPYAYVSSGSSSSSSPVPPSTNNTESSTNSSVESSDQEEDKEITDTVSIYHHSIGHDKTLIEDNAARKTDDASSTDDTDETAESSHDDQKLKITKKARTHTLKIMKSKVAGRARAKNHLQTMPTSKPTR